MTMNTNEHGFISVVYDEKTHEELHTCLFACFLSQEEPKRIAKALSDPAWVEAMQEELLQFKLQKVWILVDLPKEEGIDYDEVFAPVARIKAIRLFLAYASFMGFMVYQMDVKSAFLYGTIEEEVYVCQPLGFEDPDYSDKVYKVVKALYGLHRAPRAWYGTLAKYLLDNGFQRGKIDETLFIKKQKGDILLMSFMGELNFFLGFQVKQIKDGIFISQDKYEAEILRKFSFINTGTASTSMIYKKLCIKDSDGMIIDIMLHNVQSARFQVTPKVSHSHAVKRIFSLDRKSTTGGCQFLGCRLISWQCKKQTVVATSSTEAEYVAAASCCRQVLWIQNQMLDYGYNFMHTMINIDNNSTICIVKNPVSHTKTKHIEIRYHFIRDCYDKKLIQVVKIHTDHNFADLLTKALDVGRISTARHIEYLDTKIPQSSGPPEKVDDEAVHKELGDRMERAATTASSLEAEQDSGNINRTQSMATLNEPSP
ncbi:putative ribonuclease H-like domain-containing protein [Tanacetum coccineum]|uniref:Ribonuclease H-like domain-containing protein n=1 Tax=Tanacetum coccineum TaxID=301880 RepID=A0ABQ5IU37_9ASTR